MQALVHLPLKAFGGATAEAKLASARRTLSTYSYVKVIVTWDGWNDNVNGLYAVLDGDVRAINDTITRLATGLYPASLLQYLK